MNEDNILHLVGAFGGNAMNIRNKVISIILSLTMAISLSIPAVGAESGNAQADAACNEPNGTGRASIAYRAESLSDKGRGISSRGEDLPEEYDSRYAGCITPVLDQHSYNCCWAFSIISASESSLILNNGYSLDDLDLSELHLVYYTFGPAKDAMGLLEGDRTYPVGGDNLSIGGLMYMSTIALARWNGVVKASDAPEYTFETVRDNTLDLASPEKAYKNNLALLTEAHWISMRDTAYVKKNIMEKERE